MHMDRSMFWLRASNLYNDKQTMIAKIVVFQFSFTIILDQILITVQCWCWSMINSLDHQNNVPIAFAMSEHLGLYTLILNIPVILAIIQGFCFSHLAEKGRPGTI